MFQNYFRTAWRSFLRNKLYSVLNVLGLAIGMAVALLIGLWLHDQVTYDCFFPGYTQTYQVRYNYNDNGVVRNTDEVCIPLAGVLKQDIPEIEHAAVFGLNWQTTARVGEKRISLNYAAVGPEYLQVFPFRVIEGNAATALQESGSLVLTQSRAKAIFGNADPIGKMVYPLGKVTAVIEDAPRNSSIPWDCLGPFRDLAANEFWVRDAIRHWDQSYFRLYVSLRPGATYAEVEPKIRGLIKKYAPGTYTGFHQEVMLQPWKDRHLYTEFRDGRAVGGLIDYVRLFGIVGILVLLIACINFMNLSTARSEKRAREVGVRKVMGSSRTGLIIQFLVESVTLTAIAFIVALMLVQGVLPGFNALAGTTIQIPFSNGYFWLIMLSYVVFTGLLAGSRPAFYLSSFQPVKVLKGSPVLGRAASWPRKALVVVQFTCSIALIIGTIIVYQQIQYGRQRPLGYDPNRLLLTAGFWADGSRFRAYRQEVLQTGVVSSMTQSLTSANYIHGHNTIDNWPGRLPNEALSIAMNSVADSGYFKTLGMSFAAGRNFSDNLAADTTCAILNEAAVRRMRLQQPINAMLSWTVTNAPGRLRVVGVVKDAVVDNPFGQPEPMIFVFQPAWTGTVTYRLAPTVSITSALDKIKPVFKKYNKESSFDFGFMDDLLASNYALEVLIGRLAGIFAALAIFISCLGLFGLAAYVAEQRTKEIGIRKVLGASAGRIYRMLTRDFVLLVAVSSAIASPLAFYFLQNWLEKYSYRITINPLIFVGAAGVALLITAATISVQAIRAAGANPATSLRAE
ncbi:MAG TPA: ABC transporter permease [Puia sp.]|jgi:putative ABC transport system permease protein|nr:ABC transporter permease [Puia sp.]